ncbi:MAG: hypothetical protein J5506_06355 [Prevotella sp.]|nr:hypothetical protein [Prevotella sp.]
MKKLTILCAAIALCLMACTDKKPASTNDPNGKGPQQTSDVKAATSDTHHFSTSGVTIHKQWVSDNDDGTQHMFDLTDPDHFVEAMTFPEKLCRAKHKYGIEQGQFYYINESIRYKVMLFKDGDESSGQVSYLLMTGADNSDFQLRFSYSDLKADQVTINYPDGSSYVYKVLDKHAEVKFAPKFQDQDVFKDGGDLPRANDNAPEAAQ